MHMNNRDSRRINTAVVEVLESRKLLSCSVVLDSSGVLKIAAGPNGDRAEIKVVNGNQLKLVGRPGTYNMAQVKKIQFNGGAGNDYFSVPETLTIPVTAQGGPGFDTLVGGAGNDTLAGGQNGDLLIGRGGHNTLVGGQGNNRIIGDGGDYIDGSLGTNLIQTGSGAATLLNNPRNTVNKGGAGKVVPMNVETFKGNAYINNVSGYDPEQIRTAYNFGSIDTATYTGAGQTIYIVDAFTGTDVVGDFTTYCRQFDLPTPNASNFQIVNASGYAPAVDSEWAGEINLDLQWARAIAPQAKIVLVQADSDMSSDLLQALKVAANMSESTGGGVVSLSLGTDPSLVPSDSLPADFNGWNAVFQGATHTTFTVSSGDAGGYRSFPATSPYVTAVGGTNLPLDADGNRTADETAWIGGGGGQTSNFSIPAYQQGLYAPNAAGVQTQLTTRGVPDVAYNADPNTGVAVYISTPQLNPTKTGYNSGWFSVGGTSAGAPQWAGLVALANQARAQKGLPRLGNSLNGSLYQAFKKDSSTSGLDDIISGSAGTNPAGIGYDLATGLGVPDAQVLIGKLSDAGAQPFYFQGNFSLNSNYYISSNYYGPGTTLNVYSAQNIVGAGTLSAADTVQVSVTYTALGSWTKQGGGSAPTPLNQFFGGTSAAPNPVITLYRASNGRIYGTGFATIYNANNVGPVRNTFTLHFEGYSSFNAAGVASFKIDFWAIDPVTGQQAPSGWFNRPTTGIYGGSYYSGTISST